MVCDNRRVLSPRATTRSLAAVLASVALGLAGSVQPSTAAVAVAPPTASSVVTAAGEDLTSTIVPRLTTRLRAAGLGAAVSGMVFDDADGRLVWGTRASYSRLPASTLKLVTAYTALRSMGKDTRFATPTLQDPVYPSIVYLKGVGDPSLTSSGLNRLAAATATKLLGQGIDAVSLKIDDVMFPAPTNATGWLTSYVPTDVAPVRPLVYNSRDVADTSIDAGLLFMKSLGAQGIRVRSIARAAAPAGSTTLAFTYSQPLSAIVGVMLQVSQNDYAEILLRDAAAARGRPTTWSGATRNAIDVLVENGITTSGLVMYDGSGLSRSDRVRSGTLVGLLSRVLDDPDMSAVFLAPGALPDAGRTGTLAKRYRTAPTSCAAGIIRAKTGSLADVVALAGLAYGIDGRTRQFVFLVNGPKSTSSVIATVDTLAATATGCM